MSHRSKKGRLSKYLRWLSGEKDTAVDKGTAFPLPPAAFDAEWYVQNYQGENIDPDQAWAHYRDIGFEKRYNPCEFFWTKWYLENNKDVADSGINALLHYENSGCKEGRVPCPVFDSDWYVLNYAIDLKGLSPLAHYVKIGREKRYQPNEARSIQAFLKGIGSIGLDHVVFKALSTSIDNNKDARMVEGRLTDGRTHILQIGSTIHGHPLLDEVSEEMHAAQCQFGDPYWAELASVAVIPGSCSLIFQGTIVNDEINTVHSRDRNQIPKIHDHVYVSEKNIAIRYTPNLTPILAEGIHFFKEYEQNYFHFVCELLVKLPIIESIGISVEIPLLVSDDLDQRLYEAINLLKHKDRKILKLKRNNVYVVDRLIYVSDLSLIMDAYGERPSEKHTFLPMKATSRMVRQVLDMTSVSIKRPRKIYLTRNSSRGRILNEEQIIDILVKEGFEILEFSKLSFASQVQLFHEAEVIIGATGAAFTNMLWCRADTQIYIMYSDHELNNMTFWDRIAEISRLKVKYIIGKRAYSVVGLYAMHDDFSVNPDALMEAIR